MFSKLTILTCALLSVGLAQPAASQVVLERYAPIPLTRNIERETKLAVSGALKDPRSAIYGPMTAGQAADLTIHVCGLVNSKNSMGGYTGMAPYRVEFLGTPRARVFGPLSEFEYPDLMFRVCDKRGISIY